MKRLGRPRLGGWWGGQIGQQFVVEPVLRAARVETGGSQAARPLPAVHRALVHPIQLGDLGRPH